jgi:hypothetical protein
VRGRTAKLSKPSSAAAALLLLGLLGGCGGSSPSAPSTGTTTSVPEAARPQAPGSGGKAGEEEASAKLKEQAGKAAPFLAPGADNSIPTYGSQGSGSQQGEAQAALAAYLKAREAGRWGRACALMGTSVRGQVRVLAEASGRRAPQCSAALVLLAKYNPPRERKNILIGSLAAFRVKGNRGFALFHGPHRQQFMMPMVREGGAWKVSQSIPVAYPVGAPVRGGH